MPNKLSLAYNTPLQLSLLNPEGEIDDNYDIVRYQTNAGTLELSANAATKLNLLELRVGEQFQICKHLKDRNVWFDVWLANESERGRAAEETDPDSLEPLLRRSLERVPVRPERVTRKPVVRVEQPQMEQRGTGTNGPAPKPAAIPSMPPSKPQRASIPYNVAFRETVAFVTTELKATGEQWSDQARQDMVSTILIAAAKQGLLTVWERENG